MKLDTSGMVEVMEKTTKKLSKIESKDFNKESYDQDCEILNMQIKKQKKKKKKKKSFIE
jgi:hypothetical protein